jgi:hypothetical protein
MGAFGVMNLWGERNRTIVILLHFLNICAMLNQQFANFEMIFYG